MSRCDFCSFQPVRWQYPCDSFVVASTSGDTVIMGDHGNLGTRAPMPDGFQKRHVMEGDWAACQTCHELIQDGNIDAVTDRCIRRYYEIFGPEFALPSLSFSAMHHGFINHRTGEPVPVKE